MRKTRDSQPSLTYPWLDLDHAKELKALSDLLDEHPRIRFSTSFCKTSRPRPRIRRPMPSRRMPLSRAPMA